MSLENIALGSLGAKVIGHSSSSDEHSYPPSNVLSEKEEEIWNSAEGLPQSITVSLEDVCVKYSHIARLGFYCWHDYTTNPKSVEVEVALPDSDKLVFWCKLALKHQSGRQFFSIQPLPATYRVIKFTITETFGDYETYLNQIYIEAQMEDSQLNSMMGLNDLDSPIRSSHQQKNFKDHKYLNEYRPKQAYNPKEQSDDEDDEDGQFVENTFHNKQNYSASKHSYSKHSSKYQQQEEEEAPQDLSYQNDIALLTLSKNVMEMEENIEEIKRSLEVLNMRIDVTYEKLEERLIARVDEMVDKKMEKFKHEIKNEFKRSTHLRESKSQHENFKSKELRMGDFAEEEGERIAMPMREAKQSLHIHNLKSNRVQREKERESSKDLIVSDLMDKLAKKLKERELKIKKIESKREKEKPSNRSGLHRDPYP